MTPSSNKWIMTSRSHSNISAPSLRPIPSPTEVGATLRSISEPAFPRNLASSRDAIYLGGDASAAGSSASLKISVVSSRHVLIPRLQLTMMVFLATTSESRTGVQPPIS